MVTVNCIGELTVKIGGTRRSTRSYRRIYLYLALFGGSPMNRRRMVQALYPELDSATATNRLRVAFTTLRREIGSGFLADDQTVNLKSSALESDWAQIQQRVEQAQMEPDSGAELETLLSLLPQLKQDLAPGLTDEWLDSPRQSWIELALNVCGRIAELAERHEWPELVIQACEVGFAKGSHDEGLWLAYLKAKDAVGERGEGLRKFGEAQIALRRDLGEDFSDALLQYAQGLRFAVARKEATPIPAEAYVKLLHAAMTLEPESAMAIFGVRDSHLLMAGDYSYFEGVLKDLVTQHRSGSLAWQRAFLCRISLMAGNGERDALVSPCEELLSLATDRWIRSKTLSYLSIVEHCRLNLDQATRRIDEAIALASDYPKDLHQYEYYKGTYLMEHLRLEEARVCFQRSLDGFPAHGEHDEWVGRANALAGLSWCETHTFRYSGALTFAEQALKAARQSGHSRSIVFRTLQHAFSLHQNRPDGSAFQRIRWSVKELYRTKHVRGLMVGCELALLALHDRELPIELRNIFAQVDSWRTRTGNPRTPAMAQLCRPFAQSSTPRRPVDVDQLVFSILKLLRHSGENQAPSP